MKKSLLSLIILLANTNLFATCAKDIDMGGYRITNVGEPQDDGDVATKYYVDHYKNSEKISFYVNKIDWDDTNLITYPSIIKLDHIVINDKNCYDPSTGIFIAPVDGVYKFDISIFIGTYYGKNADGTKADFSDSKWYDDMVFYIKKFSTSEEVTLDGGDIIGKVWIGQTSVDSAKNNPVWHRKSSSSNIIVKLKQGDKISIQFNFWDGGKIGDKVGYNIHFSGYKLY